MFGRLKRSSDGKRIYLQVVSNERRREPSTGGFSYPSQPQRTYQRVIATLGRVDHLDELERGFRVEEITVALVGVRPTRRPVKPDAKRLVPQR